MSKTWSSHLSGFSDSQRLNVSNAKEQERKKDIMLRGQPCLDMAATPRRQTAKAQDRGDNH